jgi:hypothetical protein
MVEGKNTQLLPAYSKRPAWTDLVASLAIIPLLVGEDLGSALRRALFRLRGLEFLLCAVLNELLIGPNLKCNADKSHFVLTEGER